MTAYYTDDFNNIIAILQNCYYYNRDMYMNEYKAYFTWDDNLLSIFNDVLSYKEMIQRNKELLLFNSLMKKNKYSIVGFIVSENASSISLKDGLKENKYILKMKNDLRELIDMNNHCIMIMNYLLDKYYDNIYIETWRDKTSVMSYMDEAIGLKEECLNLFKTYNSVDDLTNIYNNLSKICYCGLMISNYIRLINTDIKEQLKYCNEIDIFNISEDLFELSRYERIYDDDYDVNDYVTDDANDDYEEQEDYDDYYSYDSYDSDDDY